VSFEPGQALSPRRQSSLRTLWTMVAAVSAPVVLLDQMSKFFVSTHLGPQRDIVLIPNWLDIVYTLNPGAAFSLFAGLPDSFRNLFLVGVSVAAIAVIAMLLARSREPSVMAIGLAFVMGGAAGNLIDRAVRGRVIDFIRAHYYAYNYPVFNFADSAITIGIVLILVASAAKGEGGGTSSSV
jgi:signal peptidase II